MAKSPKEQTTINPKKIKIFMWYLTLSQADLWFSISNWILIIGAVFVLIGTIGSISLSTVREHFSDLRISQNEKETEFAQKDAANANAQAESARLKALEVEQQNIKLRQQITNRRITEDQYTILFGILKNNPGTINIESMTDTESALYAADFQKLFIQAGWKIGSTNFPLGQIWIGIILYQSSNPDLQTLINAMNAAHIPFSMANEPPTSSATILIGGKPPLF